MVREEHVFNTPVTHTVLTGQDERLSEQLFTDRTDQLPLDALHRHLSTHTHTHNCENVQNSASKLRREEFHCS